MAITVWGNEGDDIIITRIDFGHGDEYLVEKLVGGCGYATIGSYFNFNKALERAKKEQAR